MQLIHTFQCHSAGSEPSRIFLKLMLSKTRSFSLEICSAKIKSQSPLHPMAKRSMAFWTHFRKLRRSLKIWSPRSPSCRWRSLKKMNGFAIFKTIWSHRKTILMAQLSKLKLFKQIRISISLTSSKTTRTSILPPSEKLRISTWIRLERKLILF